jgi:dTMP kinase
MFITFEGVEGCGKTTQARLLAARFAEHGARTLVTREPGGAAISEQIRAILLDNKNDGMDPMAEALLYVASRAQFVAEIVRPALAVGTVVICDRYADSTLAYQGYGRGLDVGTLEQLNTIATGGLVPDITLLLELSVAEGLDRRHKEGNANRLDNAGSAFHERVRNGYHALAAADPQRWRVIDAAAAPSVVAAEVWSALSPFVGRSAAAAAYD